jgi:hypothetical protein
MDLSVLHDNSGAIALYERMGFVRVPVLGVKRKNAINEKLFAPAKSEEELSQLNPYARIIADEAILRGIAVQVLDAKGGYLKLTHGGTSVVTRESLRRPPGGRRGRHPGAGGSNGDLHRRGPRLPREGRFSSGEAGPRRTGRGHHRRGDPAR